VETRIGCGVDKLRCEVAKKGGEGGEVVISACVGWFRWGYGGGAAPTLSRTGMDFPHKKSEGRGVLDLV